MILNAKQIEFAGDGWHGFGSGLLFHVIGRKLDRKKRERIKVITEGSRRWIFRKTFQGKRPGTLIGRYSAMSLSEAQTIAKAMCDNIKAGVDPRLVLVANPVKPLVAAPSFKEGVRCADCGWNHQVTVLTVPPVSASAACEWWGFLFNQLASL